MAEYTSNYNLEKQQGNEYINIEGLNSNFDTIDEELKRAQDRAEEAFQSASNGKQLIAGAITGKGVPTNPSDTFQKMADNINAIETDMTGDATATAGDLLSGKTAYVKGNKITGTIPSKNAATIIPSTTDQTIAAGQYLSGAQIIKGDANLVPANIVKGKKIFNVTGTAEQKVTIAGEGTATVKYSESLSAGQLVVTRRHFGMDTLIKVADPSTLPPINTVSVDISPDGNYVALVHPYAPGLIVYKRNGDTFTKLTGIESVFDDGYRVRFSPSGTYMAVSGAPKSGIPPIVFFKQNGDTFTRLTNVPNISGTGTYMNFRPDGMYFATSYSHGRYMMIFKRSGDAFTEIADQTSWSLGGSMTCCPVFSPDGKYLAAGTATTLKIWRMDGETFTIVHNDTSFGKVYGLAFSPDGTQLIVNLKLYKRSGDTFTYTKAIEGTGFNSSLKDIKYSSDGRYIAFSLTSESARFKCFKVSGDTFTELPAPSVVASGPIAELCYNPVYPYLIGAHQYSPFMIIYKADIEGDYCYKYKFDDLYLPNYINFGYTKEAGSANTSHQIVTLPLK